MHCSEPNQALDRWTSNAVSHMYQGGRSWRALSYRPTSVQVAATLTVRGIGAVSAAWLARYAGQLDGKKALAQLVEAGGGQES
jgi:hypothetical protein